MILKQGSRWEAQITSVEPKGYLKTNIRFDEMQPYLATSKIWFDVGIKSATIRGVSLSKEEIDKTRLVAFRDWDGFITISLGNTSLDCEFTVGDPVIVNFRV